MLVLLWQSVTVLIMTVVIGAQRTATTSIPICKLHMKLQQGGIMSHKQYYGEILLRNAVRTALYEALHKR